MQNTKYIIIIVVMSLVIVGLMGYIIYDTTQKSQNTINNSQKNQNEEEDGNHETGYDLNEKYEYSGTIALEDFSPYFEYNEYRQFAFYDEDGEYIKTDVLIEADEQGEAYNWYSSDEWIIFDYNEKYILWSHNNDLYLEDRLAESTEKTLIRKSTESCEDDYCFKDIVNSGYVYDNLVIYSIRNQFTTGAGYARKSYMYEIAVKETRELKDTVFAVSPDKTHIFEVHSESDTRECAISQINVEDYESNCIFSDEEINGVTPLINMEDTLGMYVVAFNDSLFIRHMGSEDGGETSDYYYSWIDSSGRYLLKPVKISEMEKNNSSYDTKTGKITLTGLENSKTIVLDVESNKVVK